MKSVGIDIGSSSIKVVELTTTAKEVSVSKFHLHQLGLNPAFDSELEILDYLRSLVASYDPATTKFVFGLRQDRVSVRHKVFPFVDRLKILKSLPFELEEDLPFSSETAVYDAKLIKTMGHQAEILACATPKHRVADALRLMADVGIDLHILSSEGIALANCFEKWNEQIRIEPPGQNEFEGTAPPRNISLILDIGHTRTLVLAMYGDNLVGCRSVLWGGKNLAEALAKRYEMPFVEAVKEMQTKAFILPSKEGASYDQIVFSDTISSSVKELARELQISILEFRSEFGGEIEKISITGGVSQILNLGPFLTTQLDVAVNKTETLGTFRTSFGRDPGADAVIGVALGLAIEGLKKPRNPPLNFLRGEFAKQNDVIKRFWEDWGTSVKVLAASFVVFFIYSSLRENTALSLADKANDALKLQARQVAKLPAREANEAGVKKYIKENKRKAQEMRTLVSLAKVNSALDIMKKITDATPGKNQVSLNIKSLKVQDEFVEIEGTLANPNEMSIFQRALTSVSSDGKIEARAPLMTAPAGAVAFGFAFKVDRGLSKSTEVR